MLLNTRASVDPIAMKTSALIVYIFSSEAIKQEFKTKIWLSVTQQFDKVELLRSAVTQAKKEPAKGKDESFLEQTLTDSLSADKFLLVLDDVWSERAWKDVLQVPVANAGRRQPGSRVLLTTRNGDVVLKMGPYHSQSDQLHVSNRAEHLPHGVAASTKHALWTWPGNDSKN
ncbi:Disease resistance protein RGA2 [Panicum miliaceum]|uniref:Disease resistance protein RGA2 n=1 Tax=Panicum miliaceum TaxID=4540 RepID=A0A3L6TA65_PANMI|nr:Disease resistance protein RGA2 [Panicum miliaceum]